MTQNSMKISLLLVAASVSLQVSTAKADQCAWIENGDKYVVKSAKKLLNPDAEFVEYCAPCGDKPGSVQKVEDSQIEFAKMGSDIYNGSAGKPAYREVKVNGKNQDLAYLYVRTGSRVFANVAMLTGCPVSDVPPFLYTAPGKSPSPVTIEDLAQGRKPASVEKSKK
jgi:hypothetical protein